MINNDTGLVLKNPIKKYTFILFASSLLGAQLFSINLGFFQLSPYRLLLIVCPLLIPFIPSWRKINLTKGINYIYIRVLMFWLVVSIFNLLWIEDLSGWSKAFSFLVCGFVTTYFMGLYITTKLDVINILRLFEVIALLFCFIGLFEIATGKYLFISADNLEFYDTRSALNSTLGSRIPISIFGNPNNFALFLLFSIFSSLILTRVKESVSGNLVSVISSIFFIYMLLATQSRSGFIGFIVGVTPLVILLFKNLSANKKVLVAVCVSFCLAFSVSWVLNNKQLFEALVTIDTTTVGGDATRINLIKNGFQFLLDTYLMGVGLGNIEFHMSHRAYYLVNNITNIHNWWMEILVGSGIFVFLFYIVVYVRNLWILFKMAHSKQYDYQVVHISICFLGFLIAFIITSMGASSILGMEWLWPIMGIIFCFINQISNSSK